MTTQIATQPSRAAVPEADMARSAATSADGTTIGYRHVGRGPGLILLHGSMSSGANHVELARLLGDSFSVFVPDRRGRGLSRPYRGLGDLDQELEDLAALREATGADLIWGLSSGAAIALQAARTTSGIRKIALFEPPLVQDRTAVTALLRRFDAEMAAGHVEKAMITAMRGAEMGPAWFRALPQRFTSKLVAMGMAAEAKKPTGPYPAMGTLAPTLHADFAVIAESSGRLDDHRSIEIPVLLMGGSKSQAYLKRSLDDLERTLPNASRVELPGLDHAASWNADLGGHPEAVAQELRAFMTRS